MADLYVVHSTKEGNTDNLIEFVSLDYGKAAIKGHELKQQYTMDKLQFHLTKVNLDVHKVLIEGIWIGFIICSVFFGIANFLISTWKHS